MGETLAPARLLCHPVPVAHFQLSKAPSASRNDQETEELIERLTRAGSGMPKKERAKKAAETCEDVYLERRSLWTTLMAHAPRRLARGLRERAADRDDYSNRQGIADLRVALADWLDAWDAEQVKEEERAKRRGKQHRRQLPLWGLSSWPTLTPQNEKALASSWPYVDMIADRDGQCLLAASVGQTGIVGRAHRRFEVALGKASAWNSRLAIATAKTFFAGDSVSLTMVDLILESMDGLYRGLMDYDPSKGRPSTHLVTWCRQRVSKALETGTMIHVPSWVRQTVSAVRRGCPAWLKADEARRKAIAKTKQAKRAGKPAPARVDHSPGIGAVGPLDQATVVNAVAEIEAGVSVDRARDLLVDDLGMHPSLASWAAVAIVSEQDPTERGLLSMRHIATAHNRKASATLEALRHAPIHFASLDPSWDEDSQRPGIVLSSTDERDDTEAEIWIQTTEMLGLLDDLAKRDEDGAEQAEIIRRSYGLGGAELLSERPESEALKHIAKAGLETTGRRVHRNKAASMRAEGIAWMRGQVCEEEVPAPGVFLLASPQARGCLEGAGARLARACRRLRGERRAEAVEARRRQRAVTKTPKRLRKPAPRIHQLAEHLPMLAQA